MKARSVDVYCVTLPFRLAFGHSLSSRKKSTNVIVRVELEDGSVGWGESIPRSYVTGEESSEASERIASQFAPAVLATDWSDFSRSVEGLDKLFWSFELDRKRWGASWCALETAVLDALGHSQKKSLATLLGPAEQGQIRYGAVIPFCGKAATMAIATFYKMYGFQTVKLKVGRSLEDDLARLQICRAIFGPYVSLRVDANCAWSLDQAKIAADRMSLYGVQSIEQPLAARDWKGLAELTRSVAADIVADESLCTLEDGRCLIQEKACNAVNIRLSKVGGIQPARKMAALARGAGLKVHMGAQVGESGILSAAGRLFACVEIRCENYEGSENLFLLKKDLTKENLTVGWGGRGVLPAGNGLGITVARSRLTQLAAIRVSPKTGASRHV